MDHPYGKAENILEFKEGKSVINEETLNNIFNHEDVKNRSIVAISTVGARRKGKSLFLNYCLRYLYANYKSINFPANPLSNPTQWLGASNEPLLGFPWKSGSYRVTTGITIWSDVFLHPSLNRAIILLDTQGLEDPSYSKDIEILSASLAMSSMQIFYVDENLCESDLQLLQVAVDTVKFVSDEVLSEDNEKPFRQLNFIVRDWFNSKEFPFGSQPASRNRNYLTSVLKTTSSHSPVQASLRNDLKSSFESLKCDLLPYPGDVISSAKTSEDYNGNWGAMSEEFKSELIFVIEKLLKPRNLDVKSKNGENLTGLEFKEYVLKFLKFHSLQSMKLPTTDSIYEMIVEKQFDSIISECIECYKKTNIENQKLMTGEDQTTVFHDMSKIKALVLFKDKKKLGNADHEKKFQEILETLIEIAFKEWSEQISSNSKSVEAEKAKTQLVIDEKDVLILKQTEHLKTIQNKDQKIQKLKNDIRKEQEKLKNAQEIAQVQLEILNEKNSILETQKKIQESKTRECETLREIDALKSNRSGERNSRN